MKDRQPSSFLDLPFEIRELIYQEVVSQEPDVLPLALDEKSYRVTENCSLGRGITRSIDGLVLANRQIGEEAKQAYYKRKRFTAKFAWEHICKCSRWGVKHYGINPFWRPDAHLIEQCEISVRLPLPPKSFREAANCLLNGRMTPPFATGERIRLQKGLNPSLRKLKIKFLNEGVKVVPRGREREARVDWDYNPTRWDPFGPDGKYKCGLVFASKKQLEKMVAMLTKGMSEETSVNVEFWGLGGRRKLEITLPLPSIDPVSTGAFGDFWASLELYPSGSPGFNREAMVASSESRGKRTAARG